MKAGEPNHADRSRPKPVGSLRQSQGCTLMAWMKRPMNQVSEYWYMGSMLASDEIAKKRIDAFHAVVVYLAFWDQF